MSAESRTPSVPQEDPLTEYQRGYLDGVLAYSYIQRKTGERVVGNVGITYRQAVVRFLGPGWSVEYPEKPA